MIRALRRSQHDWPARRRRRDISPPAGRASSSAAFSRRSLGLGTAATRFPRRSASGPVAAALTVSPPTPPSSIATSATLHSAQHPNTHSSTDPLAIPSHDPLALVRRLPPRIAAHVLVKSARAPAVFGRYEPFWAELRGRLVVLVVPPERAAAAAVPSPRVSSRSRLAAKDDAVIAAVLTVERASISRPRGPKSPVLKLSNPRVPHYHVWFRFETDSDARIWEKALNAVAAQRVVGISDFEFISPIGKGASGKVFLVADRSTGDKLALKVIDKAKVFESPSAFRHALDERLALEMVDGHPFFSRLRYAFQTRSYFYLAIDFYNGGDLYQYLCTNGRLKEPQVRAVASEVALALEHLHKLGFVYRDLKPENVLLDSRGHIRLADFGLCKLLPDRAVTNTICGTHTYAAPEMLAVRDYGKSIDLWAFGVFVFHILTGRTPYEARDLDQVIANMNNRRIIFYTSTSKELVAMIRKLLDWNHNTRLGCGPGGMVEVRGHSFFNGVNWRDVYAKEADDTGLISRVKKRRGNDCSTVGSSGHMRASRGSTTGSGTGGHGATSVQSTDGGTTTPAQTTEADVVLRSLQLSAVSVAAASDNGVGRHGASTVPSTQVDGTTPTQTADADVGMRSLPSGAISLVTPSDSGVATCADVAAANNGREAPSTEVLTSGADVADVRASRDVGDVRTPRDHARARATEGREGGEGDTLDDGSAAPSSDADRHSTGASMSGGRLARRRRSPAGSSLRTTGSRRRSVVSVGRTRARGRGADRERKTAESLSLREQMVAAAEQDDLQNFDMSEWGKISVDVDQDDPSYGDGALWPVARARRKLVEEERMMAGFGYCSMSTPLGVPDYL